MIYGDPELDAWIEARAAEIRRREDFDHDLGRPTSKIRGVLLSILLPVSGILAVVSLFAHFAFAHPHRGTWHWEILNYRNDGAVDAHCWDGSAVVMTIPAGATVQRWYRVPSGASTVIACDGSTVSWVQDWPINPKEYSE